jgi:hypothetical protein
MDEGFVIDVEDDCYNIIDSFKSQGRIVGAMRCLLLAPRNGGFMGRLMNRLRDTVIEEESAEGGRDDRV